MYYAGGRGVESPYEWPAQQPVGRSSAPACLSVMLLVEEPERDLVLIQYISTMYPPFHCHKLHALGSRAARASRSAAAAGPAHSALAGLPQHLAGLPQHLAGLMELVRSVASLAGLPLPRARDLEALADACDAAPEFARLTRHVVARLRFLSDKFDVRRLARQLAPLARLVELCVDLRQFLRKQRIKTLVMRVATARVVVEDVQALHRAIDAISTELRLEQRDFRGSEELSPAGWGGKLRDDIEDLLAGLERCTKKARPLIRELSIESVMAGLAVLKYELEHSEDKMSARLRAILFNTFGNIVRYSGVNVPKIPSWFLRLDDGSELEGISVDNCYISEIDKPSRPGKWSPHMRAVIRNIEVDPAEFERNEFIKATELWLTLNHKHVVKLCGGNHLKSMTFVAYEDAITDSFVTYFAHDRDTTGDASDSNSGDASRLARFWQLFTEIAEGIQYLHDKGIKHGDLRCSNFVISADGTAKVCDFVDRASKKADYRRQQTVRWKAPECIVDNGPDPSCEGDIFALGLSLLEAWIGEPPFGTASDDEIFELYRGAKDGIQRPDDVPDSIWSAVERLCKYNLSDRPNIAEVVGIFRECFVDAQARVEAKNYREG